MDERPISQIPWSSTMAEFAATADGIPDGGACCVFVVDESIPAQARRGYAALIIAYAREAEPVTIFEDGSTALLITDGGSASGRVAAARVFGQLRRLGLETTLRAGIADLQGGVEATIENARAAARAGGAGEISLAG